MARQLHRTRLRVGVLRARWRVPVTACARRDLPDPSIFFFFRDSCISMAFIGPNVFRCPSIFTSFSARDRTSLSESFYFTLDSPMCAMHNCRCVRRRGRSPFHFGLDTIRWRWRYAVHCRWDDDACYASSGGTCECDSRARTGWLVERKRGRSARRELGPGTSHGAVVQRHPGLPAATRLSKLSLCSVRSWSPRRSSPRSSGDAECVRVGVLEPSRVCSV
jgi:hypothetical protein